MSKFYSVGRSTRRKSILVMVLIIVASSVVTNISAIFNEKYVYSIHPMCTKSPCDVLEHITHKARDFLNEVLRQAKEYFEGIDVNFERHIKDRWSIKGLRVLSSIPKILNEPTTSRVLTQMEEKDTWGKMCVNLHHLIFHVETMKHRIEHPDGTTVYETSNVTMSILNFLYTETKQFVRKTELLLPAFKTNLPSNRYPGLPLNLEVTTVIRSLFYEYLLLLQFINDVVNHISKKYCADSVRDGSLPPTPYCQIAD